MKLTSGRERSNNNIQVNHCIVDCLLCPLFVRHPKSGTQPGIAISEGFLVSMYGLHPNSATPFRSACTPGKYPIPPRNPNSKRSQTGHLG